MIKFSVFKRLGLALGCVTFVLTINFLGAADPRSFAGERDNSQPIGAQNSNLVEERSLEMKGEFVTAVQFLPPFPSFPPGPFQPILHLLITANGTLSHLGKTTAATTDQAVDLSVNPNKGTGHWVFQNTKGDALWTEMDLTSTPPDAEGGTTFRGTLTVIGGSGKFASATGTLLGEGFAKGTAGSFSVTGTVHVTSAEDDE